MRKKLLYIAIDVLASLMTFVVIVALLFYAIIHDLCVFIGRYNIYISYLFCVIYLRAQEQK